MSVSHKKLAGWYLQLAQSLEAGMHLPGALGLAAGPPPQDTTRMAESLQAGRSIDAWLMEAPEWLPTADRYLISAAASSGRMPDSLRKLSEKHTLASENAAKAIMATLYPLAVLHLGIFLLPVFSLVEFSGEGATELHFDRYAGDVLAMLLPVWVCLGALIYLARKRSPILLAVTRRIPGLRGYCKIQAMADFTFTLEALLRAGAPMEESWYGAGLVSGDPSLAEASLALTEKIKAGEAPGPYLIEHPCFPSEFNALYQTGEQTGQLDANLATLTQQFQEKANRRLAMVSFLYPKLLFLIIAIFAGYKILVFYSGQLDQIMRILE